MKKTNGFTLVELLISISIIAILSVVLSVSFSSAQKSGRDQRRIADLKAIQNAAEQYFLLNGGYPISAGIAWTGPGSQMILAKFPTDPKSGVGTTTPYRRTTFNINGYCICGQVENYKNGNSEGDSCNFGDAAINNCRITPSNCYFCVKNQQ